jgi:hypothetical protein
MLRSAICLGVCLIAGFAHAETREPSPWQVGGGLGLTMGGDELGSVDIYNGEGKRVQSENIRAGRLFQFDAGARYRPQQSPWMVQLTFGYHYNAANGKDMATNTEDVSVYFARYPLEILPSLRFDRHSLGLGFRYDFSPTASAPSSSPAKFKDAPGGVVEYGYSLNENVTFGLRYAKIKYKLRDDESVSVEGDHVGINAKFWF